MDFTKKLELFLEVVNKGSFSRAAEAKSIDKSVFSKQIKQLEHELGVRLFNRTTRSISLTSIGEQFVPKAEEITALLHNTKILAKSYQTQPQGIIKMLVPEGIFQSYLQDIVFNFMDKYPKVTVELTIDNRERDIIADGFDLMLKIGRLDNNRLIARRLLSHHMRLIASKSFIAQYGQPKTPDDLVKFPAIIFTNGTFSSDFVFFKNGNNHPLRYKLRPRMVVNTAQMVIDAVQKDMGIALWGSFNANGDNEFVQLLPDYTLIWPDDVGLYIIYPHRDQSPLVRLMIDTINHAFNLT